MYFWKRLAVVAAVVGAASGAEAADVTGLINPAGSTLLSDNSAEILINVDGSIGAGGLPTVTNGDIIVTVVGINTIEVGATSTTIGSGTGFNELTAITAVQIATSSDVDLGPAGPDDSFGTQNIDLFQYTAVAVSAANIGFVNWATGVIDLDGNPLTLGDQLTFTSALGATTNGSTFGLVFDDAAQNYNRDGTIQNGLTTATDGAARLLLTLNGGSGDFLSVIAPLNVADFGTVPAATAIDNTNISLDATIAAQSWPGLTFGPNLTGGNGGFSSPATGSGFPIFDNLDLTVNTVATPGPSALLLLGTGFLTFAGIARRSKR